MVSVAVLKLGETDHVFMQPDAKINSVYYCHNVLEQKLLPDIRLSSNDNFLFRQDGVLAHCSRHTVAYLRCHVPEFIEPKKLAAKQSKSKSCGLFSVGSVLQQMVYSHKISH